MEREGKEERMKVVCVSSHFVSHNSLFAFCAHTGVARDELPVGESEEEAVICL